MFGRTYRNHEIIQWGYVALVGITLAFTSISRAGASIPPSDDAFPVSSKRGACLVINGVGEIPDGKMCEPRGALRKPVKTEPELSAWLSKAWPQPLPIK